MKQILSLIAIALFLLFGLGQALSATAASGPNTQQSAEATAILSSEPLLVLSKSCLDFNFKDHDALIGASLGTRQFNSGEMFTITGQQPFSVEITPGGSSYPTTSFSYTFPKAGAYNIKVVESPNTGIPQQFQYHCIIPQPLPAGMHPTATAILAGGPISFSQDCKNFNFKNHDATIGMSFGSVQFNAGEMLTITGDQPFSVQITPGGTSYPATSFSYKFPATGTYSIKVVESPNTGIPQHFEVHCTIPQPLPAGMLPTATPILSGGPINFSQDCKNFNFKNHDASTDMGFGAVQFNAGETLTIKGDSLFTVQITPGGTSYPVSTFTYTFPATGTYSIKIVSSPKQVSQTFELHCTILPPVNGKPAPTATLFAPPSLTQLQAPTAGIVDIKLCQPFKFVSVTPFGPAQISWVGTDHTPLTDNANQTYWYNVTITAQASDHTILSLVDGWIQESTSLSATQKATFAYALPPHKRIQSYTVTVVGGPGSIDYPDHQNDGTGYLKSDCSISRTLPVIATPTPMPPTATPLLPQAPQPQAPQSNSQQQQPQKPKAASCPPGTSGDPSKGVPCIAVPK